MKRPLRHACALLLALMLTACNDTPEDADTAPVDPPPSDATPTQDVTPAGEAIGEAVTQTIGAAGGTIVSSDDMLTITVPAGALAADARFAITPVTHTLAGGVGVAYQLEAPAETADVPLQVSIQVGAGDQVGTQGLGLALQDDTGAWWGVPNATVAAAATAGHARAQAVAQDWLDRRLSSILKRSVARGRFLRSIGVFASASIAPRPTTLKVGQSRALAVTSCVTKVVITNDTDDPSLAIPVITCTPMPQLATIVSASAGSLTQTGPGALQYTAPGSKPDPNPVIVSASYDNVNSTPAQVIVQGEVNVIDDYLDTYTGSIEFSGDWAQDKPEHVIGLKGKLKVRLTLDRTPGITRRGEVASYKLTGSGTWRQQPPDCDPATVTAPVYGALGLWDRDSPNQPLAGKFIYSVATDAQAPEFTFMCGNPREPVKMQAFLILAAPCSTIEGGVAAAAGRYREPAYLDDWGPFVCQSGLMDGQSFIVTTRLLGRP